jgi:DNA (cytosine-5)-methyltransferase 1
VARELRGRDRPVGRVVELFAGVGGFRLGLEAAGWEVVWANQWEPSTKRQHAFECYVKHFDSGIHVNEDINVVLDEIEAGDREPIPDHDLLVGGFPCFAAGTMVLTAEGYRPIETVAEGDLVLTHQGRWRPVTRVMRRWAPKTVVVRGQGFPDVRTTAEHPFWVRELIGRTRTGGRWGLAFGEPRWVAAADLKPSRTYASQVLPREATDGIELVDPSPDLWWVVGRYLADGWLVSRPKGRVVICAGRAEADLVEERIRRVFPCTRSEERTAVKFHVTRQGFHDWLLAFGLGASGKRVPGWVFSLPPNLARALLDGYRSGDGSDWQGGWRATTVSRALALSVALLAQRAYGVVASIHEVPVPDRTVIEGREVRQRTQYQVVVPPRNRTAFVSGDHGWKRVREVREAGPATVYNLAVEEDGSYVADGCVVHNCQDYSVAKTLNQAHGIEGRKGVLWWAIYRILEDKRPRFVFLENVDRLLKSPASQRGRDFAIMLACLSDLGYLVEWRVVNAADYGFPQRRRRVFIVAHHLGGADPAWAGPVPWLYEEGVLARALPVRPPGDDVVIRLDGMDVPDLLLKGHPARITEEFGRGSAASPFLSGGVMWERQVWSRPVSPAYEGPRKVLGDVLLPAEEVPERFYIPPEQLPTWEYLKGAKREPRRARNGHVYFYTEGAVPFPDPLDQPSRTILTGEGGATPSRFKHVVRCEDGRYRRLTPVELERLNGFPDGWTDTGMSDARRAFMMGNAIVVGLVEHVGHALCEAMDASQSPALPVRMARA